MRPRRILCPVDFSETTEAGLAAARSLATEFGAELLLLHVLNFPYPHMDRVTPSFDLDAYYRKMEEDALANLHALVDEDTRRFAPSRALVERGVPYQEIVRVAADCETDLIVIPTHGRTGLQHLLFGSVAEKVVRLAPCPVLTASPREAPHPFHPEHVLFATDFSEPAERALHHAVAIARQYEARLTMLHVVTLWESDPANPAWRFPAIPAEESDAVERVATEQLDGRQRQCREAGVEVECRLVRGFDPAAEILQAADELDTDLIVLGTHGHAGLAHALLGSVAEKVVRRHPGEVLTVRQLSSR